MEDMVTMGGDSHQNSSYSTRSFLLVRGVFLRSVFLISLFLIQRCFWRGVFLMRCVLWAYIFLVGGVFLGGLCFGFEVYASKIFGQYYGSCKP